MKVAIIGCGNLPTAIFNSKIAKKLSHWEFFTYTPTKTRADILAKTLGGRSFDLNENLEFDLMVLGMKPQQLEEFVKTPKNISAKKIWSLLAGTSGSTLSNSFGKPWVRLMPNTGAMVSEGIFLAYGDKKDSQVDELFSSVGTILWTNTEADIDKLTPYTGSGAAIFFEILLEMEKSLSKKGYDGRELMRKLFHSTSLLYQDHDPEILRNNITSKNGVTEKILLTLRDKDLGQILEDSLKAGILRAQELGGSIDE